MKKSNVRNYTSSQIIDRIKSLPSFAGLPTARYIVGVRSNEDESNVPDDKFYFFEGEKFITMTTGTTNPGSPVLKGGFLKYNKLGAAVVKADEWYYNVWAPGLHMGKMPALRQVRPIKIYRDGDKDGKSEEIGKMDEGLYGINFHTMDYNQQSKAVKDKINGWSAGCQVVNDVEKFYQLMAGFKGYKSVTYVLLNEWDV